MASRNNELPSIWTGITFKDAVENISTNNKKIKQKDYLPLGKFPIVDQGQCLIGGYTNDESKVISCPRPLIIFGDHTKILKFISQRFAPGADGVKVLAPQNFYEPKLFFYFTQYIASILVDKGYARHYQHLEKYTIPLPPINEQKRIVAKIDELFSELDKGLENLQKAQELLKTYRQALLKSAFEGKLTREWREENKIKKNGGNEYLSLLGKSQIVSLKEEINSDELLQDLPDGWIWVRLGKLINFSQNGLSKRKGTNGVELAVLRLADIKDRCIKTGGLRKIICTADEIKKYQLINFDILCIRVNGSRELVGQLIMYQDKGIPLLFCDHFIRFSPLNSEISNYLSLYSQTDFARTFIEKNMVSTAGQNTISQSNLFQMPIPFPGKTEQNKIVSSLKINQSTIDILEKELIILSEQLKALRQSILKKAFSGKLVLQDSNDEPASMLLERIKAEQSIQTSQKKSSIRQKVAL